MHMLELKNIYINYEHLVFDHTNFICGSQQITVISGNSGAGKTTLLNLLYNCKNDFCDYSINYHKPNRNDLLNMYYCKQEPLFEEHLTVQDNINLLYDIYNIERDIQLEENIFKALELEHTYHFYINSLSTGEKKRLTLVCAILSKRPIVLLDEPTASVDKKMKQAMIQIIQKYLKDKTVIISTHDNDILEIADVVYHIENHQLVAEQHINDDEIEIKNIQSKNLQKYYFKTWKRSKLYHIFTQFLSILIIAFIAVGLFSMNSYINQQQDNLSSAFTNQFVVYYPLQEGLTYSGNEYPLTEDQLSALQEIDNIKDIRNLYYFSSDNFIDASFITYNGNEYESEEVISYISYDENNDVSNYIETSINDEGIYISNELAQTLNITAGNDTITINLPVPQYNIYNDGYVLDSSNYTSPLYYIVYPNDHTIEVTLKIAGILTEEDIGMDVYPSKYTFYIPQSIYESYMQEYAVSDSYNTGDIEYKPYEVNAYVIQLNSYEDYSEFYDDVTDLGLGVESNFSTYMDYIENQQSTINNTKNIMLIFSGCMIVILFVMKFVKRHEDNHFFVYLHKLSLDTKDILKTRLHCMISNILIKFIFSVILSYAIVLLLSYLQITTLSLSYTNIILCLVFSLLIESIPLLFY